MTTHPTDLGHRSAATHGSDQMSASATTAGPRAWMLVAGSNYRTLADVSALLLEQNAAAAPILLVEIL